MFTNLSKICYLPNANKKNIRFAATYHIGMDRKRFLYNLKAMRKNGFRVDVETFKNEIPSKTVKEIHTFDSIINTCPKFLFAPDGKFYLGKDHLYRDNGIKC